MNNIVQRDWDHLNILRSILLICYNFNILNIADDKVRWMLFQREGHKTYKDSGPDTSLKVLGVHVGALF